MVRLQLLGLLGALSLALAAPTNGSAAELAVAEEAVKNGPVKVEFAKPADVPVLATSNKTVVDTNPIVQAKVSEVPAVLSSITGGAPSPTTSPVKRAIEARLPGPTIADPIQTPVPVVNYLGSTNCAFSPQPFIPPTSQAFWGLAAKRVCYEWFGSKEPACVPWPHDAPGCSPIAYVPEGSASTSTIDLYFQFQYAVRDDPSPFQQFYQISKDLCINELALRVAAQYENCAMLGDESGFSSYDDKNSNIRYKAWRLPGPPSGFNTAVSSP
ncbi:hypothetical protein BJ875DRAFT_436243 [Amylocarpus encephaloides]|uniref:Uncharacterized protein n=1 Tax=Amylocarpus encephaloides TaxID=45428 RepID=A0A9P8CAB8_9HELO|nr:hypothetical protein BJ875DRAFT_436243 [Amylocarpus encephaloides]